MEEKEKSELGFLAVKCNTGEIIDFELAVKEYMSSQNKIVGDKKTSMASIEKKLRECSEDLSVDDISRIARKHKVPINSMFSFYMVSLSPYYMDLKISKNSIDVLNKMLKMVTDGHMIDKYGNNKKIKTFVDFYEHLGVTRASFYRARLELEKLRVVKSIVEKNGMIILFNPVYIRCGNMNELTFFEFEEEIKDYNYLEYLFFKKKFRNSGYLRIIKDGKNENSNILT